MTGKKLSREIVYYCYWGIIILTLLLILISCNIQNEEEPVLKPEKIPEGWQYTVIGRDDTLIVHFSSWMIYDSITIK